MCINWLVEANGRERFPFTCCTMVQEVELLDAADVTKQKYILSCDPKDDQNYYDDYD